MRHSITERGRSTGIVVLACMLTLSACVSTPVDEVRISVKRIALSLAFEDETLAEPVAPDRLITILPAPPELIASGDVTPYRTPAGASLPPIADPPPRCAPAPEGAALAEPVGVTIDEPPKPGWYRRHNRGKLAITGGPIPITLPFPAITVMEIRDVHEVERPNIDRQAGDVARDAAPPAADAAAAARGTNKATRFTLSHRIATITVTDVYEYDAAGVRLVQRTTATSAATSVFTPTPQITMVELGNFGNDWREGGADRENDIAMVVEGAIARQEPVDACGRLVDTLRFENDEQMVNLGTQEVSGTSEQPNAYNIAPHHGGLIVREEKHFTQVVTVDDIKVVIDWDYVSTIGHLDPYPTREAALAAVS